MALLPLTITALAFVLPPSPAVTCQHAASQTTRRPTHPRALADDSPFGGLFRGFASNLASALEKVLDSGFPGQLQLIADAEAVLQADERVAKLIGPDATIGEIDVKESMSVSAGERQHAHASHGIACRADDAHSAASVPPCPARRCAAASRLRGQRRSRHRRRRRGA